MEKGTIILESNNAVSDKNEHTHTHTLYYSAKPFLGRLPRKMVARELQESCTQMFMSVLFLMAGDRKQLLLPISREWQN